MSRASMIGLASAAAVLAGIAFTAGRLTAAPEPKPPRLFQLRTYYPRAGQMDAVKRRFREKGIEIFKRHGIEVIGFWTPHNEKDKDSKLVYLICWPDMEASRAAWKSFGGDPERQRIWAEYNKDGDIVDHWEAVYLDPIDFSPLQ